jgi:hypothetical protein
LVGATARAQTTKSVDAPSEPVTEEEWLASLAERRQLRRTLAFVDQVIQLRAFVHAQPHNVFLDSNFFRGHESPPSLASAAVIQKTASDSMT